MRIGDCGQPLLAPVLLLLLLLSCPGEGCGPGRGAGRRRRPKKLTPLVFKQHVPNVSENTLGASGLSEEPIRREDAKFKDLVRNSNPDIVFQDEEGTGADRIMSQRCRDKLNTLAVSVINQWPGVKLRVTEAWDEDMMHAGNSLHYEGRAVDITTSDRDKSKNGMLARLAVEAGFDWVYYETRGQIHCSVKSDSSIAINFGGCFPPNSSVLTISGQVKAISRLKVGDRVLSTNQDGHVEFSDVISFLDVNAERVAKYYTLTTDSGHSVTLTGHHLIPTTDASFVKSIQHFTSTQLPRLTFAKDVSVNDYIFVVPLTQRNSAEDLQNENSVSTNYSLVQRDNEFTSQYFSKTKLIPHKIVNIQIRHLRGVFAPVTLKGTIVVDGVAVSCYAFLKDDAIAHAVFAPLRTFYVIRKLLADSLEQLADTFHLINIVSYFYDTTKKETDIPLSQDGLHWYAQLLYNIAVHVFGLDINISF